MSNAYSGWGRVAAALSIILFAGLLAGCQVRPLYGEASGTKEKLATVSFDPAEGRVGQEVRNRLVFLAYGGAGRPTSTEYDVKMTITSSATTTEVTDDGIYSVSKNNNYDGPYPGRVTMTGKYTLTRVSDGKVLRSATRTVTAMLDLPQQQFAAIRAVRDGEDRTARELAEIIHTDIAATLSR